MNDITIEDLGFGSQVKQIDERLTELVKELPKSFWESLSNMFKSEYFNPFSSSFKMEFVVDTNILFMEVRSLMLNNSSFFMKVYDNPLIKVYAPPKIEEELLSRIQRKFPKDKKTRDLDVFECLEKAKQLLSKIIIRDDIDDEVLKKAKEKLNNRDKDDVPFLALGLFIKGDGILTNDKDIRDLDDVKTWRLGEAGKLVCDFKKGSFSFAIVGATMESILKVVGGILSSIWNSVIRVAEKMIVFATKILQGGVEAIMKLPPEIVIPIFGISILIAVLFKDARTFAMDALVTIKDIFIRIFQKIKEFIRNMIDAFKPVLEILKAIFTSFGEMYAYLIFNSMATMTRLEEFEVEDVEAEILN